MRRFSKKIIIGSLCLLLFLMVTGYAAFSSLLNINGTSNITSNWDVRITDVKEVSKEGNAESASSPSWNDLSAYIEANLYKKGDFIEYEVTVENRGTLDATLENIDENLVDENEAVKISFSNYTKGEKLSKGKSQVIKVKIEYNSDFNGEFKEGSTEVNLNLVYTQNNDYREDNGEIISPDRYLVNYDCSSYDKSCSNNNEYLKEGEAVNLNYSVSTEEGIFLGWNTDKSAKTALKELEMPAHDITLYPIFNTDSRIIQTWTTDATGDFHSSSYKSNIISIEFLDNKNVPDNAYENWDVSEAKDGSVLAWVVADETDSTKYHLFIGANGGIIANKDSSNLFYVFTGVISIDFNNNFDTSNTTDLSLMFNGCSSVESINLGDKFVTDKVTSMYALFGNCVALKEIDVSNFNTSNVTNLYDLFANCKSLTEVDVSNFDTSNVTNFRGVFYHCESLTKINLCSWDTNKATLMSFMFMGNPNLKAVYVGPNWKAASDTTNIFKDSNISSVTQSNNCEYDAEDLASISAFTSVTTKSITVVVDATVESEIVNYEFSMDDGESWINNGDSNVYTFTDLDSGSDHTFYVRVTSALGKKTVSSEFMATTSVLEVPTYSEVSDNGKSVVTVSFPDECDERLTCSYIKDDDEEIFVTEKNIDVEFSEEGYVVAKATDNYNDVSSSYAVSNPTTFEYAYSGSYEVFEAVADGYYEVELWGAQSGNLNSSGGGKGAYTKGEIKLSKGDKLYIYIGAKGADVDVCSTSGAFNNGSIANSVNGKCGTVGGGATDVRLVSSTWDNVTSLNSRIMVAAGGGYGSAGGDLVGGEIASSNQYYSYSGKAAKQTSGGAAPTKYSSATSNGTAGGFGYAGNGGASNSSSVSTGGGATGGSGYYGGSGASGLANGVFSSGSGSSYISGFAGVNSITSASSRTHTNQTKHYSNKYFINNVMTAGVNSGDGKAKVTFIGSPSSKDSSKITGVRYIKDCTYFSNSNTANHWVEIQAINKGTNVALGKNVTGLSDGETASEYNSSYAFSYVVDGMVDNFTGNSGYGYMGTVKNECLIVDLEDEYDLEEVAVWHYYTDGRTYKDNVLSVAGEDKEYREVYSGEKAETSLGNHVTTDYKNKKKKVNVSAKYVRGGKINLTKNGNKVTIKATPSSEFTYKGATLVCNNTKLKDVSSTTFTIPNCSGDLFVYPKWKKDDYVWFQQNGTNNVSLWTTTNYDVAKASLYLVSETNNNYVRFESLSSQNARNLYATTSKYDLTDYKYWTTSLHCYDSLNDKLATNSGYLKYWKNITNNQSSFETQNASTVTFDWNNLDISKYNGSYYLTLHVLVNNTRHWCGWIQNYLSGETYSYDNPY